MAFTWSPEKLTATTKIKAIERFWKNVVKTESCWLWTGVKGKDGYGRIRPGTGKLYVRAHRFSWMLSGGIIPDGMHLLHRCDTRACVNPVHLFLGTNRENVDDMLSKGRQQKGEQINHSKLTADIVTLLRSEFLKTGIGNRRVLASKYGVDRSTIRMAQVGKSWKHIPLTPPASRAGEKETA